MIEFHETKPSDLDVIIEMERNPENECYIVPYEFDEHHEIILNTDTRHISLFTHDDRLVGFIILAGLRSPNDSIELRRIVVSEKGQGYGKKALKELIKKCFQDYSCNRLWLDVFDYNERARMLYKKEGFIEEGLLRESCKRGEEYKNLVVMSLLKKDYILK